MKKLLAMTLALSMAALTFASCGDTADSNDNDDTTTTTTTTAAEEEEAPEESEATEEEETAETEESETETEEGEGDAEGEGEEAAPAEFDITKVTGYDETATETVLEFTDQISDAWGSSFGSDFIDARTFERDKDMHMVVEFEYVESFNDMIANGVTDQHKTQIVIGPCRANGWSKFSENPEGLICDYPFHANAEESGEWVKKGEDLTTPDTAELGKSEQVWPDVFVKSDGFIKIGNHDVTSIEFTIPAAEINAVIDNAFSEEEGMGWDGILFQLGGNMYITKITIDQGNVFMNSTVIDSGM